MCLLVCICVVYIVYTFPLAVFFLFRTQGLCFCSFCFHMNYIRPFRVIILLASFSLAYISKNPVLKSKIQIYRIRIANDVLIGLGQGKEMTLHHKNECHHEWPCLDCIGPSNGPEQN